MSDPGAGPSSRRDSPSREENEPKRRKTVGIGRGRAKDQDYLENTIPTGITDVYAPITDKGESGRPVRLMTNFVKWHTPKDQLVQCYRIEFEPPIESVKLKRELITKERDLFSGAYVFDGGNELKTLTKLNSDVTSVLAEHPQGGGISITFRHSSTITWGHPEMFRLYNTQMRRNLQHLGMFQMGRYLFDRTNRRKLAAEFSVELWPGMITAINEHDAGILMALDVIHKVVRTDTVHTMLREMFTSDKSQGRSEWKARARQELPGKIVLAGYSNKTYKIDDIDFGLKASTYTFNYRNEEITLIEYMKRVHNVTILDQHQPLLIVRPTERQRRGGQEDNIYLVPEQCFLTGMTDKMLADYNLKASMATVTQQNPRTRVQTLNDFLQKFHGKERIKNEMEGWGLKVDQNLLMTTGRIMPREKLYSHNDPSGYHYEQETGNFEREMKDKAMREPIRISNWAIVYTRDSNQQMNTFCERIREANRSTGIVLDKPQFFGIDGDRVHNFLQIMESLEDKIQLVVVIVPNNNKERYDAIKKKLCCSDKPKLSQIVTKKIFNKPGALKTIVKKILIQMSVKCGGAAWALEIPPKSLMIVGFDVHHDGARRGQSVGAFVCSLNRDATKWYSRVAFHQTNQEMSTNFASHFIQGLKRYYSINNRLPEKIAVYRDGVSEGQIQHVYETEIKEMEIALETARKDLQESKRIGWAFTIVTKRVRARFFANRPGEGIVNPGPGTIVDRDVTRRQRYDFYLISQSVRKGTVSPTMYNIIGDSTGWKAIHHQQLAYKLCHLYFNWAGTITVPAPCQYARKLAYLTGTALHAEAHPKLSNYLFFL